jgi:hypothetical protein
VLDGDGLLRFVYGKVRKQRMLPLHASLALASSWTSRCVETPREVPL